MKRQISTTGYGKLISQIGKCCFLIAMVLMVAVAANAQGDVEENPDVPIDGGISLLVAAGVGYGVKKVRDARKKQQATPEENKF